MLCLTISRVLPTCWRQQCRASQMRRKRYSWPCWQLRIMLLVKQLSEHQQLLPACVCLDYHSCKTHHVSVAPQDAPYLLEAAVQSFTDEEDEVQLALLAAAMKLFFKRPPECQQLLGATLAAASAESSQDVHDRALLYYRSTCCSCCSCNSSSEDVHDRAVLYRRSGNTMSTV